MEVHVITLRMPLGMGAVNCYLLHGDAGFLLIDSGHSSARAGLLAELERMGCRPGSLGLVVMTHGDFDHTGNAAYLREAFGARLAMHCDDAGMAERGDMFHNRRSGSAVVRALVPLLMRFDERLRFTPDVLLSEGDSLSAYGIDATILTAPGHSLGSIAVLAADGSLFCGDLLENRRKPAPGSLVDDAMSARASIARLREMHIGMVYPGHGKPFAMSELASGEDRQG